MSALHWNLHKVSILDFLWCDKIVKVKIYAMICNETIIGLFATLVLWEKTSVGEEGGKHWYNRGQMKVLALEKMANRPYFIVLLLFLNLSQVIKEGLSKLVWQPEDEKERSMSNAERIKRCYSPMTYCPTSSENATYIDQNNSILLVRAREIWR